MMIRKKKVIVAALLAASLGTGITLAQIGVPSPCAGAITGAATARDEGGGSIWTSFNAVLTCTQGWTQVCRYCVTYGLSYASPQGWQPVGLLHNIDWAVGCGTPADTPGTGYTYTGAIAGSYLYQVTTYTTPCGSAHPLKAKSYQVRFQVN